MHVALLQIRSNLQGLGLPRPATLLFSHPIRGIISIVNRPLTNSNNGDEHYEALVNRQSMIRTIILSEIMLVFQ